MKNASKLLNGMAICLSISLFLPACQQNSGYQPHKTELISHDQNNFGKTASGKQSMPAEQDKMEAYTGPMFIFSREEDPNEIIMFSELESNNAKKSTSFYANPLVIYGKPLRYADFTIGSWGILSVVAGDPYAAKPNKIPFQVYLRRDGKIIREGASNPDASMLEVEISTILKMAKPEDHLIIRPTRKADWKAKRIIRLIPSKGC